MSTFNSLMSSEDETENSLHLYLESSQSSEVPQQGRSPSPRRIWRPHFESPVIGSAGACGGPQDTPSSFTRQTSTPLQGRIQQESTNIFSSCIKVIFFITYEYSLITLPNEM